MKNTVFTKANVSFPAKHNGVKGKVVSITETTIGKVTFKTATFVENFTNKTKEVPLVEVEV